MVHGVVENCEKNEGTRSFVIATRLQVTLCAAGIKPLLAERGGGVLRPGKENGEGKVIAYNAGGWVEHFIFLCAERSGGRAGGLPYLVLDAALGYV